jgi:3-hydroxyisobutyrate dehydrogenase/glyoxylate/succinic semialdehyde reductase
MRKDLHLASLTAYEEGAALPLGNAAKEIYALAERAGLGDLDFSAVFKLFDDAPFKGLLDSRG